MTHENGVAYSSKEKRSNVNSLPKKKGEKEIHYNAQAVFH